MSADILKVTGEVASPRSFSVEQLAELDARHQIPDVSKLEPSRSGEAVWLEGILESVGVSASARYLGVHSDWDNFHASIPLEEVRDRGLLIYCMDGQPVPREKGGPLRFFIPGHASCNTAEVDACANVKFVERIELTAEKGFDNRPKDEHANLHGH